MGKRARKGGVTNELLRAARNRRRTRDDEAHAIAQSVYNSAVELKRETTADDRPLPLPVLAPALVALEQVAAGLAVDRQLDSPEATRQLADDLTAYLVHVFRNVVWHFDPADFERWRAWEAGAESDLTNTAPSG